MKKLSLIILFVFTINAINAQEPIRTLFQKDTSNYEKDTYGGYGAPFVGITEIVGSQATIIGGKGGVIKNHKFVFGMVGGAIISKTKTEYLSYELDTEGMRIKKAGSVIDSTYNSSKAISMGYGGLFTEFILNYTNPIHVSIPINFQIGGVSAGDSDDDLIVKSKSVFVIEPGVSFEFNFYKNFIPSINVGYRYVSEYTDELSGIYATAIFKFGKF